MAYLALIVEDVVINKWEITQETMVIGRAKYCDIQIDDQSVSSKHVRISIEADPFLDNNTLTYVEDLGSTNGTELNGKVLKKQQLDDGDTIKVGFNTFRFVNNANLGLDETAVIVG